jgi:hypothetical protein
LPKKLKKAQQNKPSRKQREDHIDLIYNGLLDGLYFSKAWPQSDVLYGIAAFLNEVADDWELDASPKVWDVYGRGIKIPIPEALEEISSLLAGWGAVVRKSED